jgi:hypothetical protein
MLGRLHYVAVQGKCQGLVFSDYVSETPFGKVRDSRFSL